MTFWTDERKLELVRLYDETHLSCAQIGVRLGCTRNAAIGKARRLGLEKAYPRKGGYPKGKPREGCLHNVKTILHKTTKTQATTSLPLPEIARNSARISGKSSPAPLPTAPLGSPDRPPNGLCQFPMGEVAKPGFAYCACPVGNRPHKTKALPVYCQGHAELCYQGKPYRKSGWQDWKRGRTI